MSGYLLDMGVALGGYECLTFSLEQTSLRPV